MGINSYAQNFEDVMLWRALSHVQHGFYIDVGAWDPVVDSVSLAFHERGWKGIHIEPIPRYAEALRDHRPGDIILQAAVGEGPSVISFFDISGTGLSTANTSIAARHKNNGFGVQEISVPCIPLSAAFDLAEGGEIQWLKIDVEGHEREVLRSWAPSAARPWIVVIESTLPNTQIESYQSWEHTLFELGYSMAYSDGLNRYYVSSEHGELKPSLSIPPNPFDNFSLNATKVAEAQLSQLRQEIETERASRNAREESLSLRLRDSIGDLNKLKLYASEMESDFSSKLASAQTEALREWKEQESRHVASRTFLDKELGNLRARITELESGATTRERQFSEQLHQEVESARIRESNLRSAQQDESRRQMTEALAREQNLAASLAIAHDEIDAIKRQWLWRLFFRVARTSRPASVDTRFVPPATAPSVTKALGESAISSIRKIPSMNENLDASKPARSIDELLQFNDHDFVQCAYLSILGRPADPEGLVNYTIHVRAGADRLELIRALAMSPEGARRDPGRLLGLREALQKVGRGHPSYISRFIFGPISRALRPLFARVDVCEYRLGKLEKNIQTRLDAMEQAVKASARSRYGMGAVSNEETAALDKLSRHARSVYFQFEDREKGAKGKPTV